MIHKPLISVVVATKNEETNIENCLKSIKYQTYSNIEIIVVDNYSDDRTIEIAKKYTDKIFLIGPERSSQRNYGLINIAKGDFGFYVDADMILGVNLINKIVDNLRDDVVGYYIEEVIIGKKLFNKIRRFERFFYSGTPVDAVRFFLLDYFRKVNGFDEKLFTEGSGEDWDLDLELNKFGDHMLVEKSKPKHSHSIFYEKHFPELFSELPEKYWRYGDVIFHNESKLSFIDFIKKKRYYTKGFEGYIKKWGRYHPAIKKQFGLSYRYFSVFFQRKKWKLVLSKPHFFLAIFVYKFIIGLVYLESKLVKK